VIAWLTPISLRGLQLGFAMEAMRRPTFKTMVQMLATRRSSASDDPLFEQSGGQRAVPAGLGQPQALDEVMLGKPLPAGIEAHKCAQIAQPRPSVPGQ
jgi:hypothetical protein